MHFVSQFQTMKRSMALIWNPVAHAFGKCQFLRNRATLFNCICCVWRSFQSQIMGPLYIRQINSLLILFVLYPKKWTWDSQWCLLVEFDLNISNKHPISNPINPTYPINIPNPISNTPINPTYPMLHLKAHLSTLGASNHQPPSWARRAFPELGSSEGWKMST